MIVEALDFCSSLSLKKSFHYCVRKSVFLFYPKLCFVYDNNMVRPHNLQKHKFSGMRAKIASFVEHSSFTYFITAIILINAVSLGLETSPSIMAKIGYMLQIIDSIALAIFVIELSLKLYVYRLSFFRESWNVFDFFIVGFSLLPSIGPLSVLRALRVLRVLRLVSVVPQMRKVINALFKALPGMLSIIAVLLLIFYVSAVLATKLFGLDSSGEFSEQFGSIGASMFTLFQIMTLEGWSEEVVRPVMRAYPYAWLFFIPFIVITSFAVLNLFIGIIVDALHYSHEEDQQNSEKQSKAQLQDTQNAKAKTKNRVIDQEELYASLQKDMKLLKKDLKEIKNALKDAKS